MRTYFFTLTMLMANGILLAQQPADTTPHSLEGAVVRSTRQPANPSNTILNKTILNEHNLGQDLPMLLQYTPNSVSYSDAGNGIGYTGIRIRGVDPSRINVTLNGVPVNDAESQGTYWVDLPDVVSSAQDVQIQRGVGTSTNGVAAFGASINVLTDRASDKAFGEINLAGGYIFPESKTIYASGSPRFSQKCNTRFGTGFMGKWSIEGRLSRIKSDGYVDRSGSNLSSYFVQATRRGPKSLLRLIHFSGSEVTSQAWYGVPESRLNSDVHAMQEYAANNWLSADELNNLLSSGSRTYNPYTYKNQTDNYRQLYYQAHHSLQLNNKWILSSSAFLTRGYGYYEEYKAATGVDKYGLGIDTQLHITHTDLIRRRWLSNYFYGVNASALYQHQKTKLMLGSSVSQYLGERWGEVIWTRFAGNSQLNHRYYEGNSRKSEANYFAKLYYQILPALKTFAEMQVRHINYHSEGIDENNGSLIGYNHSLPYTFINPKAGMEYKPDARQTLHVHYARSGREPAYNDIMQAKTGQLPRPEFMDDLETGWHIQNKKWMAEANGYYMNYRDQLVNDGTLNDVGVPLRVNVAKSYRAGIELAGAVNLGKTWQATANVSLSRNKLKRFDEYAMFYTDTTADLKLVSSYKTVDILLSPSVVAAGQLRYLPAKWLTVDLLGKYVSRQYLDNTQTNSRSLKPFAVADLRLAADIRCSEVKAMKLTLLINNLLNRSYEPNGYTYFWFYNGSRVDNNFYYPQAGTNAFLQLTIGW